LEFALAPPWADLNHPFQWNLQELLVFLIDNILVMFGGRVFQQTVGTPMGTNCVPLLADFFLYSYEAL
jgi:hypothetical protein